MKFDPTQPSFEELKSIIAERTQSVVFFCGAGLSKPAGLPSWSELRQSLLSLLKKELQYLKTEDGMRKTALATLAETEADMWQSFQFFSEAFGATSFESHIRQKFAVADSAAIPATYELLWRLPIDGIVTLNIDSYASRAFAGVFGGKKRLRELNGLNCSDHPDLLVAGTPFVVNLHGVLHARSSWIFTKKELAALSQDSAYATMLQSLFSTRVVIFIGLSADDEAVAVHLRRLRELNFHGGRHFWITSRNDEKTRQWAEANNIRLIYYSAELSHDAVIEIVDTINRFQSRDVVPEPVTPSTHRVRGVSISAPEELEKLPAEEIRQSLNQEAVRILGSNDPSKYDRYAEFWSRYAEAIHRAWSVSFKAGRETFMGYKIRSSVTKGGFGTIYEGEDASSGKRVAIKILHNAAKDDTTTLQSFRRGVKAMRILSDRSVVGMVPYAAAWEIPPCAVMDFIDGPNLHDAVRNNKLKEWPIRLRVAHELTSIIQSAHSLPERVLHRDIRPANIMLNDLWADDEDFRVCVLDFDLAWHRDATEYSVLLTNSMNGFLAPEQAGHGSGNTRNALVDSYGLGMTFYYMATSRVPMIGESSHADWENRLRVEVSCQFSAKWKSLPNRYARLIFWCTQPEQEKRWDVTRILGELGRLRDADLGNTVRSVELLAEELLARSKELSRNYTWDLNQRVGIVDFLSGFIVSIEPNETEKKVYFRCCWTNKGDRGFESVRKYVERASSRFYAILKQAGWEIVHTEIQTDGLRLAARFSSDLLFGQLDRIAGSVDSAIEAVRFGSR